MLTLITHSRAEPSLIPRFVFLDFLNFYLLHTNAQLINIFTRFSLSYASECPLLKNQLAVRFSLSGASECQLLRNQLAVRFSLSGASECRLL